MLSEEPNRRSYEKVGRTVRRLLRPVVELALVILEVWERGPSDSYTVININ
jgi:hypothetical protein